MKKFLLFISDLAILFGSLLLTLYLRYGQAFSEKLDFHLVPFSLIFAVWLVVFYIANLYEPAILRNNIYFYSSLLQSIVVASAISVIFFYLVPLFSIAPKTNLAIFIAIFTGMEFGARFGFNKIFEKKFKKSVLIVGLNKQSFELAQFIKNNPQLGYDLRCVVDLTPNRPDEDEEEFKKFGIIQGLDNLEKQVKNEKIDTIVISPEAYQNSETINIFYKSLEQKISFFNLASFYERLTGKVPLGAINQIWFLENLSEGKKRGYELTKRVFDTAFAVIIGVVSLVLYPLIALAIKTSSSGPVFYKQKRFGQSGKTFEILKFRTMRRDAEKETGAVWTTENDPRITRVGNFLRKTRLDEFPQVWNILRGEMSFVGPRAERPEFHELLQKDVPFYEERYLIKPGLTGWAQINFHYGSSVKDAAEKLKYDLYYIKNRSLLLDLGIILKTIRITLKQAGR
ncbi:MAG TPA: sugar transferase [Candidatus Paceibacterota bacterium]|nr:sugar transferase [Candidatus Paceibacterota bacterium]